MTKQYQSEDINGQLSPLSLQITPPSAPPVAGGTNTEAVFFPTAAADAVIVGNGISIAGDAALGTIIQFSQPGVFVMDLNFSAGGGGAPRFNVVRGALLPITAGNGFPFVDVSAAAVAAGVIVSIPLNTATPPGNVRFSVTFQIASVDLTDVGGVVNPNRQVLFSLATALIPALSAPGTSIVINRT